MNPESVSTLLSLFGLVALISFAGSLHPGTVNLAVIQTTLTQNRRAGLWLALGGSLPEFGYGALSAGGLMALPVSSWTHWLSWASLPVLLGAGWAAFWQKPVVIAPSPGVNRDAGVAPFWKGVTLAATNPQLLPFWSAVWLYLNQTGLLPTRTGAGQWVFALGTSAGAFALLLALVYLADRQRHHLGRYLRGRWFNYLGGGVFVAMAVWQAIR
ncbi:LysE family translocator, partial [Larkinella sp. VNQ87]|uniref:LysE family translocator n=1 Tax=Larkinella sp. VNQ87 TaxID=3400921 RepID=UPI003C109DF5